MVGRILREEPENDDEEMKAKMKYLRALCVIGMLVAKSAVIAKPNVIVILVDDMGYYDLECYGATEVKTPRIDQIAREGIRYTDYYAAAPICSPSRVGLLTGCYPARLGMATWVQRPKSKLGLHPDEVTMGEVFQGAGYATACIGKWHVGERGPLLPSNQGFEHYFGVMGNLDPFEVIQMEEEGGVPLLRNDEVIKRPADENELTKLYTDEAIAFITRQSAQEQPFFVYLAHTMLHNPLGVGEEFRGSSEWGEYGDAIQELDHYTGKLIDALKEQGQEKNTVVVFLSDNGRGPGRNENQPIQGRKLHTMEGGIRVAGMIWGPGIFARTGEENKVVTAMDWYATLASLAGIELDLRERPIDGRDLSAEILGLDAKGMNEVAIEEARPVTPDFEWREEFTEQEYRDAFFYHGAEGGLAAVRSGDLKLTLHPSLKMYDLRNDPGETKSVRSKSIRKLRGMAVHFQEEMILGRRPVGRME